MHVWGKHRRKHHTDKNIFYMKDKVQLEDSNSGQIYLLVYWLYPSALIRSLPGEREAHIIRASCGFKH